MIPRHHYRVLDSTNLEALRRWSKQNSPQPLLVIAAEQKAGRGRLKRPWASPAGGLWFSLAWPLTAPAPHYANVALIIGLATAQGIERATNLACRIKWPNDLVINGKKVAGILCELHTGQTHAMIVIGVGINANFPPAILGEEILFPPTSLLEELGQPVDLTKLLDITSERIEESLVTFAQTGLAPFRKEISDRLAWLDEVVTGRTPTDEEITGILRGIDDQGRARIDQGERVVTFATGDLSKVRRP